MKHNATRLTICLAALLAAAMATKPTDVRAAAFFTSEAQFEAALGQERPYMESFETRFENGPSIDSVPGVTMVALTTMPEGILSLGLDHDPRALPTHAQRTMGLVTSFAGGGLRFEFDTPIDAFAIDIIGALNSGYGNQPLTMTTSNGDSRVILTGLHPPDGIRFGGVIDDTTPFTSVTIFDSLGGDGVQFDRLRFRPIGGAEERISRAAFPLLAERVNENRENFFVYRDADSGFNHGFPSGLFGAVDKISIEADCP